ncbi:hypothetical protein ACT3SP_10290 [Brachybacterium sp. AOP43-C2-M15]|uniref:hypothetical protein n=1 Tax=Brachybacterium sp. AOP43-C2-M15 TaxID=3457661 RepID=UPI0040333998
MSRTAAPVASLVPWPVFTRSEALAAGVHPERLRRSDLVRLRRGLFAVRGHDVLERDIALAVCRSDPRAVVVGPSAARLHGMPLPRELEAQSRPVHIALPTGRNGSDDVVRWRHLSLAAQDVEVRRFAAPRPGGGWDQSVMGALRLSSRPRTWRDLAADLSHDRSVSIGDSLVRTPRPEFDHGRTAPWCTLEELRAQCTGRHTGALERAARDVRVGADSPTETLLRLAFQDAGLPAPRLNERLRADDGSPLHTPDFHWEQYRVCAEYDGAPHNADEQVARDIRRARRAARAGWTEVRLHAADLRSGCAGAIREVSTALQRAGWPGPQRADRR